MFTGFQNTLKIHSCSGRQEHSGIYDITRDRVRWMRNECEMLTDEMTTNGGENNISLYMDPGPGEMGAASCDVSCVSASL